MRESTTIESTPPSPPAAAADAYAQNFMVLAAIWAPILVGFWFVWHVRQFRRPGAKP